MTPWALPHIDCRGLIRQKFRNLRDTVDDVWENAGTGKCTEAICFAFGLGYLCTDLKLPHSDSKIHWMGPPPALHTSKSKLLLYFPGPAFSLPPLKGHFFFLWDIKRILGARGIDVTVAIVEHDGPPSSRNQMEHLQDGLKALHCAIYDHHFPPSSIVIGGDSSGGNTAIALMSLLAKSNPSFITNGISELLAGIFLISPWVCLTRYEATESFEANAENDVLTAQLYKEWASELRGSFGPEDDFFTDPVAAPVDWWTEVPKRATNEILVVAGGDEILLTKTQEFVAKMKQATDGPNVCFTECESEVHIHCMLHGEHGLPRGRMSYAVWDWLGRIYEKEPTIIDPSFIIREDFYSEFPVDNLSFKDALFADDLAPHSHNSLEEQAARILEGLLIEVSKAEKEKEGEGTSKEDTT